jgi:hypothetical protein
MKRLIIFGVGKIADVAYHHFLRDGGYEVVGFTCDAAWLPPSGTHYGLPVVAFEDVERHYPPESVALFAALGYHELNSVRAQKCATAKAKGYTLASYVSPRADLGPWVEVGENCLILDGVGIQPGATIGGELSIGADSFLGAATLVLKSAPERSVFIAPGTEKFRLDSEAFLRMTRMAAIGPGRK